MNQQYPYTFQNQRSNNKPPIPQDNFPSQKYSQNQNNTNNSQLTNSTQASSYNRHQQQNQYQHQQQQNYNNQYNNNNNSQKQTPYHNQSPQTMKNSQTQFNNNQYNQERKQNQNQNYNQGFRNKNQTYHQSSNNQNQYQQQQQHQQQYQQQQGNNQIQGQKVPYKQSNSSINLDNNNNNNVMKNESGFFQGSPNTSQIYIPCMNCEELVHMDDIEKHSSFCFSIAQDVKQIEQSNEIIKVNFKIKKLINLFKQLIEDVSCKQNLNITPQKFEQIATYLSRMYDLAYKIYELKPEPSSDKLDQLYLQKKMLKDYYEQLKQLGQSSPNSLGIKLYLDRLIGLVKLKYQYLNKEIQQIENPVKVVPYPAAKNQDRNNRFQNQNQNPSQNQLNMKRENSQNSMRSMSRDELQDQIYQKQKQLDEMMRSTNQFQQQANQTMGQMNQLYKVEGNNSRNQSMNNSTNSLSFQRDSMNQMETVPTPYTSDQKNQHFNFLSPQKQQSYTQNAYNYAMSQCSVNTQSKKMGSDNSYTEITNTLSNIDSNDYNQTKRLGNSVDINGPNSNEQQRIFYSKCISQRMRLPNNHPCQKIPITLLYKEAQNLGLEQNQWEDFIQHAFRQSEEYLDNQKMQRTKNKTFTNNLAGKAQNFRPPMNNSSQKYSNNNQQQQYQQNVYNANRY